MYRFLQKPKIPEGYREVLGRESIKPGDRKWDPAKNKWYEISVSGGERSPLTLRRGCYCRKIN